MFIISLKFRDFLHSSKNVGWKTTYDKKKKKKKKFRDSPKNLKKHIPRENGAVGLNYHIYTYIYIWPNGAVCLNYQFRDSPNNLKKHIPRENDAVCLNYQLSIGEN